jgi:PmbA protein
MPGANNLYVEPGEKSEEEIIASVDDGLYVIDTLNVGGLSPITGRFSTLATGFRIEDGKLGAPVSRVTVAGDVPTMLQSLEAVGSRLEWPGSFGAPALVFPNLTVGGK